MPRSVARFIARALCTFCRMATTTSRSRPSCRCVYYVMQTRSVGLGHTYLYSYAPDAGVFHMRKPGYYTFMHNGRRRGMDTGVPLSNIQCQLVQEISSLCQMKIVPLKQSVGSSRNIAVGMIVNDESCKA